jgi:hypothetical protein
MKIFEIAARSINDPLGYKTHQLTLPDDIHGQTFHLEFVGSSKKFPNTVRAKYDNEELYNKEYIVTVYDRLTNEVEVIHLGQNHLKVTYDFANPEEAQEYLDEFHIKLLIGKGYIK